MRCKLGWIAFLLFNSGLDSLLIFDIGRTLGLDSLLTVAARAMSPSTARPEGHIAKGALDPELHLDSPHLFHGLDSPQVCFIGWIATRFFFGIYGLDSLQVFFGIYGLDSLQVFLASTGWIASRFFLGIYGLDSLQVFFGIYGLDSHHFFWHLWVG